MEEYDYNMSMDDYIRLPHTKQIQYVENILISLWDNGDIELIGFDKNNEPIFDLQDNKYYE